MCCVCGLLCKIISFIASLLSIALIVLLILWLTGVIFDDSPATSTNEYLKSAGEYKYSGVVSSFT